MKISAAGDAETNHNLCYTSFTHAGRFFFSFNSADRENVAPTSEMFSQKGKPCLIVQIVTKGIPVGVYECRFPSGE